MATTAEEDEALRRKNAVFAAHPAPGVGAPGSTPATDAGNLAIASAMERSDLGNRYGFGSPQHVLGIDAPTEVLRARRDPSELIDSAIQSRRDLLAQNIDPDAPARYVTPKRRQELLHEELALTQIQHEEAVTRSVGKAQAYKMTKDIQAATDLEGLVRDMHGLKSPLGSKEHADEATAIGLAHPAAINGTKLGGELFKTHTAIHDAAANTAKAIADYKAATGLEPESVETTATGGVNIRGKTPTAAKERPVPANIVTAYAKLQSDLAGHATAAKAQADKLIKAGAKGTENTPYTKSAEWAAAQKEAEILEKHFPSLKSESTAAGAQTEKVVVQKGGKQFRLPKSQLKDAQTQGYELVQ